MAVIFGRKNHTVRSRRIIAKSFVVLALFLFSISFVGVGKPLINPVHASSTNYTLTEWTVPTASSGPYGISLDPSGNCCWFLEFSANNLAHFDPVSGTFQEWALPTANAQPTGVTTTVFSGQMMVWGTEFNTNKVFVFYPSTNTFYEFTLPTANSGPEYLSVEPSGASVRVWVTEIGTTGTRNANGEFIYNPGVPTSATLYEDSFPVGAGGGANGVYAGAGVVWFQGFTGIVKWDRVTNQYTSWPLPPHGSAFGRFLTLDALGQVWYTQGLSTAGGSDNYVGVLRGDNTFKDWQIPTVGADPRLISINPSTQHPWVAEDSQNAGSGKMAELDPSAGGTATGFIAPTVTAAGAGSSSPTAISTPSGSPSTHVVAPSSTTNIGVPNGQFTEWSIGAGTQPHDVVVDSSGNIWFLESGANKIAKLSPTAADFILGPTPPTISIPQGGSGTVTITGTSQLGFSGPVTLSVTGAVPAGVTFSTFTPNPISVPSGGSSSAILTVNVAPSALLGTSAITVSGTGSPGTHTTAFALTVISSSDFSLSLSSPTLSVGAGSSATDTVTITSIGSFSSAVALSAGALLSGVHVSFSSASVTPPPGGTATSDATVSVDPGTPASTSTITITGTSGSLIHSQPFTLSIVVTADFTISGNPVAVTLAQGGSGSSIITVTSTNGFNSAVALSYSWLSAPSGISISLPGPVTPSPGTPATSTLQLSASSSASTGSFTLAVTGTSGLLIHTVNLGIIITTPVTTSTTTSTPTSPCLIATATYGSELAPEVQLLRNFRDHSIMKTQAGSSFMLAFNAWYYSFSPYVANYISTHVVERTIMKGVLYPLIGMLYLTSNLYANASSYPEIAALLSGLLASTLIGAFYLGMPLGLLRAKVRRLRGLRAQSLLQKLLGAALLGGIGALLMGEVFSSPIILMLSSATIVLSTLFLSAAFTSAKVARRLQTAI